MDKIPKDSSEKWRIRDVWRIACQNIKTVQEGLIDPTGRRHSFMKTKKPWYSCILKEEVSKV